MHRAPERSDRNERDPDLLGASDVGSPPTREPRINHIRGKAGLGPLSPGAVPVISGAWTATAIAVHEPSGPNQDGNPGTGLTLNLVMRGIGL
jgi:hypothetical protein